MQRSIPFTIYNASAGSGKTYTLVKEYLGTILRSSQPSYYKYLLAITFTNKAVGEMKARIISTLVDFASASNKNEKHPMLVTLASELGEAPATLQQRAQAILKHLLHHYSHFSVETIDRFNHQLLRTFARDLKLSSNFEVSLDTDLLLREATDALISKAGEDPDITNVLLQYALEKTDDDKSWDISRDISEAAHLLVDENERSHIETLREHKLSDFLSLKTKLQNQSKALEAEIVQLATETLHKISIEGIDETAFPRQTLPNHFRKVQAKEFKGLYTNTLQSQLEDSSKNLYKKDTDAPTAAAIDALHPYLLQQYLDIQQRVRKYELYDSLLKNLIPLSVIQLVQQEFDAIKEERNLLPISDFNTLIHKEIKNQPAPFIYERLGEKYRHFFIDEHQDTSKMQWDNLVPLIGNALTQQYPAGQTGSLLLVGDAKQSIYRWRGGWPEQFMALYGEHNPFPISKEVKQLDRNWRSREEIVHFNNSLFTYASEVFASNLHTQLYIEGNRQLPNTLKDGYVELNFIEKDTKDIQTEEYAARILKTIAKVLDAGYSKRDICIITRKKKDGAAIGEVLATEGIPVVSPDTLLLSASPIVQGLMAALQWSLNDKDQVALLRFLDFLYEQLQPETSQHDFLLSFFDRSQSPTTTFEELGIAISPEKIHQLSLYETFEYIIRNVGLSGTSNAYLFGFMDLVHDFEQQPQASKQAFLEYWEEKKEKASIATSSSLDAVQLMTIHKAKGLEFPIVLYPFADTDLYNERMGKIWYPLDKKEFGFEELQIKFNKEVAHFGDVGEVLYEQKRSTLEMDQINLLYVTLTRAVDQLYIFTQQPNEKNLETPKSFPDLLAGFLSKDGRWRKEESVYTYGSFQPRKITGAKESTVISLIPQYDSISPQQHNLSLVATDALLWDSEVQKSIVAGNYLHDFMATIKESKDVDKELAMLEKRGIFPKETREALSKTAKAIVSHPDLAPLFMGEDKVLCERDILSASGEILRPDRINIHSGNTVTLIDYKTGGPQASHNRQIALYAGALSEMGYHVKRKILLYCKEASITLQEN
ncbi:UvrD-helicase domain-containing protein [Flavobacteriaceae bacterium TK19130]|nr:UvrD-helicase domain-containing protein [Thermobacterium salinum]